MYVINNMNVMNTVLLIIVISPYKRFNYKFNNDIEIVMTSTKLGHQRGMIKFL